MKNILKERNKKYYPLFKAILSLIKRYNHIAIFRHLTPDFDALGSQLAFKYWLNANFASKDVIISGDNHVTLNKYVFPELAKVTQSWFNQDFLAIILDTANKKRIADPRYSQAKHIIRIDHHPLTENWGHTILVDDQYVACAELVAAMLLYYQDKYHYVIPKESATYLYIAIVGDSGGFKYEHTTAHTFEIARRLIELGADPIKANKIMFHKPFEDLAIRKYVLDNFKLSEHGVAYYILDDKTQKQLNIKVEQGKEVLNMFQNIEGINAWLSVTEDVIEHEYRVSIRSNNIPINEIASHYKGGGHPQASGARIKKLSELPLLIKELDDLFI